MYTEHPLLMTLLTLVVFRACEIMHQKLGRLPVLNPVLVSIVIVVNILIVFDISYVHYKAGTEILHFLLAPAIVALAVPLYQNLGKVKPQISLILTTIFFSGIGIVIAAILIGVFFGLSDIMLIALMTKSVSAPIALEITGLVGGSSSLAVIAVFSTGLTGVIIAPTVLKYLKIKDESMQGLTLGVTAHAFGIARALEISPIAAAFATMGMGLMGCFTVFLVPILLSLFNIQ